jgi:hypothetical protein
MYIGNTKIGKWLGTLIVIVSLCVLVGIPISLDFAGIGVNQGPTPPDLSSKLSEISARVVDYHNEFKLNAIATNDTVKQIGEDVDKILITPAPVIDNGWSDEASRIWAEFDRIEKEWKLPQPPEAVLESGILRLEAGSKELTGILTVTISNRSPDTVTINPLIMVSTIYNMPTVMSASLHGGIPFLADQQSENYQTFWCQNGLRLAPHQSLSRVTLNLTITFHDSLLSPIDFTASISLSERGN